MNSSAVCIFGSENINDFLNIERRYNILFPGENLFFHVPDNDSMKSLWLTSNKKRKYEIENNTNFDLCVGIGINDIKLLDSLTIPKKIKDSVLYYSTGCFNHIYWNTEVYPRCFYANSITFDRTAEYIFTQIKDINLKVDTLGSRFYFHLKYLKIKAECINYENSSLFKRTT